MPTIVICAAKPTRGAKKKDACGIELRPVDLGIPHAPQYGHVAHVRWTHWPTPKQVTT